MNNKIKIHICLGSSCYARGNGQLVQVIKKYIRKHGLEEFVMFSGQHCYGSCSSGPNIKIDGVFHSFLNDTDIEQLLDDAFKGINPINE